MLPDLTTNEFIFAAIGIFLALSCAAALILGALIRAGSGGDPVESIDEERL